MSTVIKIEPGRSIKSIAAECLKAHNGNWEAAAAAMRGKINKNPKLFRELMQPLIDQAIWAAIRHAARDDRLTYTGVRARDDDARDVIAMGESRRKDWLNYYLSSGIRLGDADLEKLQEEAAMHQKFAKSNQRQADFYLGIAEHLEPDQRVQDALGHNEIELIWRKVSC